ARGARGGRRGTARGRAGRRGFRAGPPDGRRRLAGLEHDDRLTASERVGRAGDRLDGEAAAVDARLSVAREERQVGIALVQPERDLRLSVRTAELDAGKTVVVALEVGEGVVDLRHADRLGAEEVVLRALDALRVGRNATIVDL